MAGPTKLQLQDDNYNLERKLKDATQALNKFKQDVVEVTVDFDGGCNEGKQEFLEQLGLEWPVNKFKAVVEFTTNDDYWNSSLTDAQDALEVHVQHENKYGEFHILDAEVTSIEAVKS